MEQTGAAGDSILNVRSRKRISQLNGDYLIKFKDLRKTDITPIMKHRNRFHKECCERQVVLWRKERNMKVRDINKTQEYFKQNYFRLQSDKQKIQQEKQKDDIVITEKEQFDDSKKKEKDKHLDIIRMMKLLMKQDNANTESKPEEVVEKVVKIDRRNEIPLIHFM
ncbi:Hypothetical predicted protein [Mytilus galloprovincialis]|uniref:Uncharacterized protein n=1 Tax=Mytilus galloprovincialis TaxID=29158 RepID=A0A8B6BTG7_MYTGA|nr:Hypothetical predicted protein [Mytilus galloprovincialis]